MKSTKFTPSAAVTTTDWNTLRSKFGDKKRWNVALRVLNSKKKKRCRLISVNTLNVLLRFSAFCLLEQACSCPTNIKNGSCLLSVKRKPVSKIRLRIQQLCKTKEAQVSYWKYKLCWLGWKIYFWYLCKLYFDLMFQHLKKVQVIKQQKRNNILLKM